MKMYTSKEKEYGRVYIDTDKFDRKNCDDLLQVNSNRIRIRSMYN